MNLALIFAFVIFAMISTLEKAVESGIESEYRPIFGSEMQFDVPTGSSGAEVLMQDLSER